MQSAMRVDAETIQIRNNSFQAAKCETCGAKMYPRTLLKSHRTRHRLRHRWFLKELRKLQCTMAHMRDVA